MNISSSDRSRLREVAAQCADLAASERNQRLKREWTEHALKGAQARPMVRIEIETFEKDVLPALMKCEGDQARAMEARMLRPVANFTLFEDDTLVPDCYRVSLHTSFVPFGLKPRRQLTDGVGHHFIPYLHDLEEDESLLSDSVFSVDEAGTQAEMDAAAEIFGDILPVRRFDGGLISCLTQDIVHIMNMDDMYVAMLTDPDRFHALMRRLTDDYLSFFSMLEKGGHLRSAAQGQHLCQGSYCFTDELPDGKASASLKDCWLYMDSQESSGISPELYAEIVFPYYQEIMSRFGLVSYGCCEATHPIWDGCLSKIPNLRKLSVSPWCDEEAIGERLRGTNVAYLRKPPATLLGVGSELDEQAVRDCFALTRRAAQGCSLEIIQRDVYQINNTPDKVRRYVSLIRETFGM